MSVFVCVVVVVLLSLRLLCNSVVKRRLVRLFCDHSVAVTGEKGSGKDLLFGYVINRRRKPYISNVDYSPKIPHEDFEPTVQWSCGGNTLRNLVEGVIMPYDYPYPDGIDYYVSDAGVYFPAQENSFLNNRYKSVPMFAALSRHLGDCRIHYNCQLPSRVWDKLREQCTRFVWVRNSRVLFGRFVRMRYVVYERLQSCQDRILPMRRSGGKFGRALKAQSEQSYGRMEKHTIYFIKRYRYDDRAFKARLLGVFV